MRRFSILKRKSLTIFLESGMIRKTKEKADCFFKQSAVAGAIRIELISLVLETKAQPLYQTPNCNVLII